MDGNLTNVDLLFAVTKSVGNQLIRYWDDPDLMEEERTKMAEECEAPEPTDLDASEEEMEMFLILDGNRDDMATILKGETGIQRKSLK